MSDFSHQEIKTRPDDLVYLSTDGYTDQFGGEEEKKFRRAQFREVLLKNHKIHFSGSERNASGYL